MPIPGINKLEYLDENLASVNVVMSAVELRQIDESVSKIEIHGKRLAEGLLQLSE